MNKNKNIILVVVILLIVGSIWYFESQKPVRITSDSQDITVNTAADTTTATATGTDAAIVSSSTAPTTSIVSRQSILNAKSKQYSKAKELSGIQGYINSAPFTLSSIAGKKVILIDFWTYSCINCVRTIPYLNAWYQKYKDQGLVIVGVHTPEFDFEKNLDNVTKAVKQLGIQYPVVLDSNYGTWNAYNNRYWPHELLIDIDGYVVDDHIGEGGYDDTEKAIQKALQERATVLGTGQTISTGITPPADPITMDVTKVGSSETYFGSARNEYLANGNSSTAGSQTLKLPATFDPNKLYLDGTWNFLAEYAKTTSNTSKIVYNYNSKNVYFVASADQEVKGKILIDGKPITPDFAGTDVAADGTVIFKDNRLYNLVKGSAYGKHILEIDIDGAGLNAYTFTFG